MTTENNDVQLIIKGFNNIAEARDFCEWYCGAGEDDSCIWFEARVEAGVHESGSMKFSGMKQTEPRTIEMQLKCQ